MVLWVVQQALLWIKRMWHLHRFGGSACVPNLPRTQTNEHLEFPILPDVSGCTVDGAHEPAEVPYSCLPVFIWGHLPLLCAFEIHLWLFCQSKKKKRHTRGKITNSVKYFKVKNSYWYHNRIGPVSSKVVAAVLQRKQFLTTAFRDRKQSYTELPKKSQMKTFLKSLGDLKPCWKTCSRAQTSPYSPQSRRVRLPLCGQRTEQKNTPAIVTN